MRDDDTTDEEEEETAGETPRNSTSEEDWEIIANNPNPCQPPQPVTSSQQPSTNVSEFRLILTNIREILKSL